MVRSVTSGLKRAARARDSDADEDEDEDGAPRFNGLEGPERKPESFPSAVKDIVSRSAAEGGRPSDLSEPNGWAKGVSGTSASPQRRHTFSICNGPTSYTTERGSSKRRTTSSIRSYLTMTPQQANNRKWLYAGYVYTVIISIILVGIRPHVGKHALGGREPIGWAIGYMLGNVPSVRLSVVMWNLERWVSLPARASDGDRDSCRLGWVEHVRRDTLGEANTRLLICGYWLAVVAWGMAVVLRLSSVVEVDTRRKVFHGMMVAMLLPATFVDPTFAGFALILVLAIFLLLDLLRASQLPPLSRPLARFLTPYVDGRDLRGPVVVSHIFLLVGCAVPLWLCLAGLDRTGSGAWTGWDVTPRDVSMVSGVVCVGMGDAAASLLGRRYGRRKWPWGGGKSIEGSLAFALAVMVGLGGAKAWLRIGGWPGGNNGDAWTTTLGKVALASCGASLTEAVLTGGNDNVVVPVVLWVLVSGLAI
ncbi:MAG: hypothetical protein M1832_000331 [Thelocarpon impressellum]|nr:MAG: hypothetical protein M1832_000331 [Thelocarpon impressellum]